MVLTEQPDGMCLSIGYLVFKCTIVTAVPALSRNHACGYSKDMARVLVVDDLLFMRLMLRDILDQHGFELAGEARNGHEAVAQFQALQPDVVLLDITMPHLDGISALKQILALDPAAKVVMCSAISEHATILKAVQIGARDYIVKPFRAERVVSALNRTLGVTGVRM